MRRVKEVSYLFPVGLSCVALMTGCHHHSHKESAASTYYQQPSYAQSSTATSQETSRSSEWQTDQGATGSQTQQTTGTGEIQSERMVIPLHEEQVQVGKRTVDAGTVRLRKQITTETVNQPVQIRKETIVVEREGAGGTTSSQTFQSGSTSGQRSQFQSQSGSISQPFEQGEIVIHLQSEEPVIEKKMVPAGNIVVETRPTTEQVNVQQQVRKETIQVDKGNAQNVIVSENLNQSGTTEAKGAPQAEPQTHYQSTTPATPATPRTYDQEYRAPVTTEENAPFERPAPDGKNTFPELNKNPQPR